MKSPLPEIARLNTALPRIVIATGEWGGGAILIA